MKRALFRYYGGKYRLAPWIVGHFPSHTTYVEPFCGTASVFFLKFRSDLEVLNDANSDIVNLFRVLREPENIEKLSRLLEMTPYSREEYEKAFRVSKNPIERARRLLIRSGMGYYGDSVNLSYSGFKWKKDAHSWASFPKYLKEFSQRLRGVIIENSVSWNSLLSRYDSPNTLFYLDPPYPKELRGEPKIHSYQYEFSENDHCILVKLILSLKGMVFLSGYKTDLYRPLEEAGWKRFEKTVFACNNEKRTECLWTNCIKEENLLL